ncbi:MAG: aminotransferase class III-fold pyridoxal phosphate-dependent enzyme, partial [Candidatus Sumerlaeia bacterium]|nr:aminotransferase class III-fold pyridoxal phosphate-dependent enzyme [Candidatus Sumerlaeia bacterium]
VICEPVVGNMGCVAPVEGFLQGLRDLCTRNNAVLIFDEVMTGFRLSLGGAQERFGVMPDLTTLGKVIGGGLPVGAYGGSAELMKVVAPVGPMYQAGTLSGNPLGMAAGLAQLGFLRDHPDVYTKLEKDGDTLANAVTSHIREKGYPCTHNHVGSMGTVFFHESSVNSWDDAARCDTARFAKWFWYLMERGVYMPCAQFEAYFHSNAHDVEQIEETARVMCEGLDHVFGNGS